MDLFTETTTSHAPLADAMRPQSLTDFIGQEHLVGASKPLRVMIESGHVISMVLWGPPGVGKTTIARLLAKAASAEYFQLSAVASGVGDLREVIEKAKNRKRLGKKTILFIDEIHRFNKSQQDALLHSVEDGTILLIGATTENPSFEVISALLSRCRVFILNALEEEHLRALLASCVDFYQKKIKKEIAWADGAENHCILFSTGDARKLINGFEFSVFLANKDDAEKITIDKSDVESAFQKTTQRYDKSGEGHYDTISAFIKSIRGSDPNAALHYLARMLDGGEEPRFIARRLIVHASEDIGNADPFALVLANSTFDAVHKIGMPEARIILSQTTIYLATAPKSNASYKAIDAALKDVRDGIVPPIPLKLRNAPTKLMKQVGYSDGYNYPHDHPHAFVDEQYLPEGLEDRVYYQPSEHGREKTIGERLRFWWKKKYNAKKHV